jgi:hypothetical protein
MKLSARITAAALALGIVVLYACRDTLEPTQPSSSSALISYRLTLSGLGTGSGKVISSPAGISCTITAGTKTGACSALFSSGVTVKLTAKPTSPDAFAGWGGFCKGTSVECKVPMKANRTVSAEFRKGPFTISISSGTPGSGSGKVTSQSATGLAISCTITNGALSGACSRSYAGHTMLTLTATPAAGFVFDGWREPGCGTGKCLINITQTKPIVAAFVAAPTSNAPTEGRWDPSFRTPVVVVHAHQLSTGKVLLWGDTGDARLWSPTGGFTPVPKPYRIYCSGHSFLPDGRLLVVGGTSTGTAGLSLAKVFNPATSSWNSTASMFQGRYYPTVTTLPNGHLLAMSGHNAAKLPVTIPEVWTGTSWRRLTTAPLSVPNPYYPFMFVAPNGKIFFAGFTQPTRYLDVSGTGQWTTVAQRNVTDRVLGSAVMYAPGKILYVGGGNGKPWDGPPTASAEVIDLNQAAPTWRNIPGMAFARKQLNTTILADGSVLVTGGTSGPGFNNQGGAVHVAELWNPVTETWKTVAAEYHNRVYHSTALLLPSARVLSSGSGEGGDVSYANSEFSAQVYSPPYLYNADGSLAARPTITSAPARLAYGQTFTVQTPNAASVPRGNLIRLSSVTHGVNMSQLLYPLTFTATSSSSLSAVAPKSPNLAPPGFYMLFLINESGVPSVAKFVRIGP